MTQQAFELGLVLAGGASGGAYTAGVLDFLFEALEEWERAKVAGSPDVPDHAVRIKAAAGTSAGGICAALTAMLPFTGHAPIRDLADEARVNSAEKAAGAEANLFYRSWVRDIDLVQMLADADVARHGGRAQSLLNGEAVAAVADKAVATVRERTASGRPPRRSYFADALEIYITLANMRGVPYLIQMRTAGGVDGHRVTSHADYAHFAVLGASGADPGSVPCPDGATEINWGGGAVAGIADGWDRLRDAALATSAFPVGLPAQRFDNDRAFYQAKRWRRPAGSPESEPTPRIIPSLPTSVLSPYRFWCVDGGLLDNEPLELARVALSGAPDVRNARDAESATRAVLMIDPFPDDAALLKEEGSAPGVLAGALGLLPVLIANSRFKPEELALALHDDVYSRFLIAPMREGMREGETDLASAGLSGFTGFAHAWLRMHDFQLGRRNCQKFLKDHLVVHVRNPVVADWCARLAQQGKLEALHPRFPDASGVLRPDRDFVPLVPLVGTAADEVRPRRWPTINWPMLAGRLDAPLKKRVAAVVPSVVEEVFEALGMESGGLLRRFLRGRVVSTAQDRAFATALEKLKADLEARGLLAQARSG